MHYGGQLGAPVFREIATRLYAMYVDQKPGTMYAIKKDSAAYYYAGNAGDIKKVFNTFNIRYADSVQQNSWASVYASNYQPVVRANNVREKTMPNVKGMGLKDALQLLEKAGLKVEINGRGKVSSQSIVPGAALAKGMTVMLELS